MNQQHLRPPQGLLRRPALWLVLPLLLALALFSYGQLQAQEETPDLPAPVQDYYIPMPEDQLLDFLNTINSEASSPLETVISIVIGADNTIVYYDHWEDGYEIDVTDAQQDSTLIWGDGNPDNGAPPGFPDDEIGAGSVIVLRNDVPVPREGDDLLYDGRDHVSSSKLLAVTRAGWPVADPGSQLAGATVVYNSNQYGQQFIAPVGIDTPSNLMFEYTAFFVMAAEDGTQVTLTNNGDLQTVTLGRGESQLFTGIVEGAELDASAPVQVYLVTGDVDSIYEARIFALFSRDQWSNNYYSPVSTTAPQSGPTYVYLYNPQDNPLSVQQETVEGAQDPVEIPANSVVRLTAPQGSGAHYFTDDGSEFYPISTIDSDETNNQIFDWGFTLIPNRLLSPAALVGWGPGNLDRSCTPGGAEHPPANPVWAMATDDTDLLVDYDGNPNTGELTDANGNQFDERISVQAFESVQLFDSEEFGGDFDQTGMRVYVIEEDEQTNVAVVWGQDPTLGTINSLCNLDMGTSVLPVPAFVAAKDVEIVEGGEDGDANPGDVLEYTVTISQQGPSEVRGVTFVDELPEHTTYVPGSATVSGPTDYTVEGEAYPFGEEITLGDLGVDEQFMISFQVEVDTPLPEDVDRVRNMAIVRAQGQESRPDVETPIEQQPDLAIDKTDDLEYAEPGETVVYELTYSNLGSSPATGVELTDIVPENTTFNAEASSPGWDCEDGAPAGTTCTADAPDLEARSETMTGEFAVTVDPGLNEGTMVENVVTISDDGEHGPDANPDNNRAEEDTPVPVFGAGKGFELIEDNDGDGNVDLGDTIRYRLTIAPSGPVALPNVAVQDALPEFTNYIPDSTRMVAPEEMEIPDDETGTPFPLDDAPYEIGDLEPDQMAEIVFDVQVDECFVDRLFNEATVSAAGRERTVSVETVLDTGPDLALIITDAPQEVEAGSEGIIEMTYVNVGNADATEVTISATVPPAARLVDDNWDCTENRCTLEVGDVDSLSVPGATSLTFAVDEDVTANQLAVRLEISAGPDNDRDPAPGNNITTVRFDIAQE